MRKLFAILLCFCLVSADWVRPPVLQDPNRAIAKVKATYIYNFTKYIDWPASYKKGNFVIGVLGKTPFYTDLSSLLVKKSVGEQKFEIKNYSSVSAIGDCHILFIPADNSSSLKEVLNKIKGHSTLIVTEKSGLAKQGSGINFVVENNKQRFELNKSNIEKYQMAISSTLMSLAIEVK